MSTSVRQLVVMADGEVRIPPRTSEVAHGHRAPDQHLKIVMPAGQRWLLVELEVEIEEPAPPGPIGALG